jgi:hypothetical protein
MHAAVDTVLIMAFCYLIDIFDNAHLTMHVWSAAWAPMTIFTTVLYIYADALKPHFICG